MSVDRKNWMDEVEAVIRSRHYTWLPEGLGGEPVDVAMTYLLTDIMHICQHTAVSFDQILDIARKKFRDEEREEREAEKK